MRRYMGGGQRGPWQDGGAPEPFQRADGTQMTHEEVARVARGEPVQAPVRVPLSDETLEEVWRLANEIGQAETGRRLGLTQSGVQYRLDVYMKRHNIRGDRPGQLTTEQLRATYAERAAAKKPFPAQKPDGAQARAAAIVSERAAAVSESEKHSDAEPANSLESPSNESAREEAIAPPVRVPRTSLAATPESAALTPLLDWLEVNGLTWSQLDAERWVKAFLATVDLVYPTRATA